MRWDLRWQFSSFYNYQYKSRNVSCVSAQNSKLLNNSFDACAMIEFIGLSKGNYMTMPIIFCSCVGLNTILLTFTPLYSENCDQAKQLFNQGALLNDGSYGEAKLYEQAITLCPTLIEAHNNLGWVYVKQRNFKQAVEAFKTALSYHSDYDKAMNNLATAYGILGHRLYEEGSIDEACKILGNSIRYGSDYTLTKLRYGMCLLNYEDFSEAIKYFQKTDEYPSYLYYKALAHYKLNEQSKATRALMEYLLIGKDQENLKSAADLLEELTGELYKSPDIDEQSKTSPIIFEPTPEETLTKLIKKEGKITVSLRDGSIEFQIEESENKTEDSLNVLYLILRIIAAILAIIGTIWGLRNKFGIKGKR